MRRLRSFCWATGSTHTFSSGEYPHMSLRISSCSFSANASTNRSVSAWPIKSADTHAMNAKPMPLQNKNQLWIHSTARTTAVCSITKHIKCRLFSCVGGARAAMEGARHCNAQVVCSRHRFRNGVCHYERQEPSPLLTPTCAEVRIRWTNTALDAAHFSGSLSGFLSSCHKKKQTPGREEVPYRSQPHG